MAWIRIVPETDADPTLKALYDKYSGPHGVDHIIEVHSLNPESMEHHYNLYEHLMRGPSGLSRAEREMIAVVVSTANRCHY